MITPQITVVIPLYNAREFLNQTLESLINQSFQEWKCIIVDDGSIDDSKLIVEEFTKNDARFELMNRCNYPGPKGANSCRNIGLKRTLTKLVMFVDSDDFLADDCLEHRIDTIKSEPLFDYYIFKTAFVDNQSNIIGEFINPNSNFEEIILRLIRHEIPWHTMSPVWQKGFLESIGGWNNEYERLQDVELNLRALIHQPKIYFSESRVDSYYRLSTMTSEKKRVARLGFCRIVKDYYDNLMGSEWISFECKEGLSQAFQDIIETLLINYIQEAGKRDLYWEKLYLQTLSILKIEDEEIRSVQNLFTKIT